MHSSCSVITSREKIQQRLRCLVKKIFSCHDKELQDVDIETTVNKNYIKVIDENMSNNLEGFIINEEALLALKT